MKKNVWRAGIEIGFIIFLFYSNLLMGEFERSGMGQKRGLAWAIADVFTSANFEIAALAALVGYIVFEFLRKRFLGMVSLGFAAKVAPEQQREIWREAGQSSFIPGGFARHGHTRESHQAGRPQTQAGYPARGSGRRFQRQSAIVGRAHGRRRTD